MGSWPAVRIVALFALLITSLVAAQKSGGSRQTTMAAKDYWFDVDAEQVWTDTGLDFQKADRVFVYGGVLACGGPSLAEKADLPLPSSPAGGLLAKLQPEVKPVVASPDAELPVIGSSHLYLGVNGWRCTGKLPARVHLERPQVKPIR
jgi:hypothetical protein